MKTPRYYQLALLILLAILQISLVSSIDINDLECDAILQCDDKGVSWGSGATLVCNGSTQDAPDTEEVTVTEVRVTGYCDVGDDASDCVEVQTDNYEETSDGTVYLGSGFDRFGGITVCCDFAETTAYRLGIVNDYNSDRSSYISREWSVIDSDDNILDACPTDTYNPVDITQTSDLSTFNISFMPLAHDYDQWVEPNFDVSSIWSVGDYYLQDYDDTKAYQDILRDQIIDRVGTYSWDLYDIFAFTPNEHQIEDIFDTELDYLKDSCESYSMTGCTSTTSTAFECTAGTGVNIKSDLKKFLNTYFNLYKTPLIAQLGHEWCFGPTSSSCFTGTNYWEVLYGIEGDYVLTYQGMRGFTKRPISRIQSDWVLNDYDAVMDICESDADLRLSMAKFGAGGQTNYRYDSVLDTYALVKGETYWWGYYNDETTVVTTDSLFRFDWTNDASWNTDYSDQSETEGLHPNVIDTSSSTSQLTLLGETWGKGGTNQETKNYRIYDNAFVNYDLQGTYTSSVYTDDIVFDPFGTSYYDIGQLDYVCLDVTQDGIYDYVWRVTSGVTEDCATDGTTTFYIDTNLYDNTFTITSSDVSDTPGLYDFNLMLGIDLINSSNYYRISTHEYTFTAPEVDAQISFKTSYINIPAGTLITYDLSDTVIDLNPSYVCYDIESDATWDQCAKVGGGTASSCGGITCTSSSNPLTYEFSIDYADVLSVANEYLVAYVEDEYGYNDQDSAIYDFNEPSTVANINRISPESWTVSRDSDLIFDMSTSNFDADIFQTCYDYDVDGVWESCFSKDGTDPYCGIGSCTLNLNPEDFDETIEFSDVGLGTHSLGYYAIDVYGFYNSDAINYFYRDYYDNVADIRRVAGSIEIGNSIDEFGYLIFNLGNSIVENEQYVCYDYTTDGTYDQCYSNTPSDSKCGISCDYFATPSEANIQIDYFKVSEFGAQTLTGLLNNGDTTSLDTEAYFIFDGAVVNEYDAVIVSTDFDSDINDDFRIDIEDIDFSFNTTEFSFFEWTAIDSNYTAEPEFSCWGNNLQGLYDTCYQIGGGYNAYCGIDCYDTEWYDIYSIGEDLGFESDKIYEVYLVIGNSNTSEFDSVTYEFLMNPLSEEEQLAVESFPVIIVTAIATVLIVVLALFILLFGTTVLSVLGIALLGSLFSNEEKEKEKEN